MQNTGTLNVIRHLKNLVFNMAVSLVCLQTTDSHIDAMLDRTTFEWTVAVARPCPHPNGITAAAVQFNVLDISPIARDSSASGFEARIILL